MLGGEKFPPVEDIFPMAARGVQFYNAYGVTEMSVWQSLIKIDSKEPCRPFLKVPIATEDRTIKTSGERELTEK